MKREEKIKMGERKESRGLSKLVFGHNGRGR
jgi:hypothetical protein